MRLLLLPIAEPAFLRPSLDEAQPLSMINAIAAMENVMLE
jgi:hypothetical protein